ncbi:SGNH/GDSL hydrolase family protein [Croceitalea sp. MTPC9]|uniref:SGNH/GDSL hydrolase family protein n=1 Tax=unclassified Croceitalea TaxID=2632280 RepID=UPI002B37AB4E|nr:SGNH/GDSL hydrolase family protein [Croceitalea sp. MTPC6]GMN17379.1 SGNH/GDSL hydrolase family protein [Croceitalea sp. MTPC9]
MKKFLALIAMFGLLMVSCSDDDTVTTTPDPTPDPITYTSGSADFTKYVSLGNSLTAGFSDAALFQSGQAASFPNMLATNFALAGGGEFNIPLMTDDLGGLTLGGTPIAGNRLILSFESGSPTPVPVQGQGSTEVSNVLSGPFNNMGVPGAKSYHLLAPGYGNVAGVQAGLANPYFARFASAPDATILGDAAAQSATFFSLWIGNNDVLGYVTAGGAGVDQTGNIDPSTYGGSDISDPNVVAGTIDGILQTMTANNAEGVIANIPDVTTIPFLTTVPYNPLDPTNPAFGPQIPTLNAQFAGLNQVFAALNVPERQIVFSSDAASAVIIKDENLTDLSAQITGALQMFGVDAATATVTGFVYGQARQANANDLLVLTSSGIIAQPNENAIATLQGLGLPAASAAQLAINGVTWPLDDQWVLTPEEQETANNAVTAFNQAIEALATQYDIAFVDANSLLVELGTSGFTLADGSVVNATFGTGGGFSLDGVHPSPRGYAILANAFVEAINTKYGSNLPGVNPLNFTGLYIN